MSGGHLREGTAQRVGGNNKRRSLIQLGVEAGIAYAWSRTRLGGWRMAQSPILRTTITVERLDKRGYLNLLDYYHQRKSH